MSIFTLPDGGYKLIVLLSDEKNRLVVVNPQEELIIFEEHDFNPKYKAYKCLADKPLECAACAEIEANTHNGLRITTKPRGDLLLPKQNGYWIKKPIHRLNNEPVNLYRKIYNCTNTKTYTVNKAGGGRRNEVLSKEEFIRQVSSPRQRREWKRAGVDKVQYECVHDWPQDIHGIEIERHMTTELYNYLTDCFEQHLVQSEISRRTGIHVETVKKIRQEYWETRKATVPDDHP